MFQLLEAKLVLIAFAGKAYVLFRTANGLQQTSAVAAKAVGARERNPPNELTLDYMEPAQFHRITKALADPRRLSILERIAGRKEIGCASLCEESPVSQATMSHHLKELVNAGLVKERRQAKFVFYQLQAKVWSQYLAELRRRIPAKGRSKA